MIEQNNLRKIVLREPDDWAQNAFLSAALITTKSRKWFIIWNWKQIQKNSSCSESCLKIFIISFQSNLHAFFSPFLSCPYYCLCITFKSDINLQICTITHQNIKAFSTFSPLIMLPMETKKVCCVWNQCLFFGEMYKLYLQHI